MQHAKLHLVILVLFSVNIWLSNAQADEMSGQRGEWKSPETVLGFPDLNNPLDEWEQSVGFYSNGQLFNGTGLDLSGAGFVKILRPRKRHWGNFHLVEVIKRAASYMAEKFPDGERLQIGDLSAHDGGRISHHVSHQNGLDVDIVYYRNNKIEQDPNIESGFQENFVRKGQVTANFDYIRNWQLVNYFVHHEGVNRIFVDPIIKMALCERYRGQKGDFSAKAAETLRRLRPWRYHKNHLHLRLKCPEKDLRCRTQVEPPEDRGCKEVG